MDMLEAPIKAKVKGLASDKEVIWIGVVRVKKIDHALIINVKDGNLQVKPFSELFIDRSQYGEEKSD